MPAWDPPRPQGTWGIMARANPGGFVPAAAKGRPPWRRPDGITPNQEKSDRCGAIRAWLLPGTTSDVSGWTCCPSQCSLGWGHILEPALPKIS